MSSTDTKFKIFAYMWTKIYIAPIYLISFIVPYLKRTIEDYENIGNKKPIILISSISSFLLSVGFYFLANQLAGEELAIYYLVFFYLGIFLWGVYWLFMQSDYQRNTKRRSYRDRDAHH